MIARQPYLPRFMAGGPSNPLGARALYLGNSIYRIHGTNAPSTIGGRVSSGCIRMLNDDVVDLYGRVKVGSKVVVLPDGGRRLRDIARPVEPRAPRQAVKSCTRAGRNACPGSGSAAAGSTRDRAAVVDPPDRCDPDNPFLTRTKPTRLRPEPPGESRAVFFSECGSVGTARRQSRTRSRCKSCAAKKYFGLRHFLKRGYVATGNALRRYRVALRCYRCLASAQQLRCIVTTRSLNARLTPPTQSKLFRLIRDTNPHNFSRPRQCGVASAPMRMCKRGTGRDDGNAVRL